MRAHNIAPNAPSAKNRRASRTKTEPRDTNTGNSNVTNKKRKADQFAEDNNTSVADDEEGFATNIKADPVDDKSQLRIKEEGQLSLEDATNLMQFYDTPSFQEADLEAAYGATDYESAGSSAYHTPIGGSYGMQAPLKFSSPFETSGISSIDDSSEMAGGFPHPTGRGFQTPYQPYVQYTPNTPVTRDNHGRPESPVVVE